MVGARSSDVGSSRRLFASSLRFPWDTAFWLFLSSMRSLASCIPRYALPATRVSVTRLSRYVVRTAVLLNGFTLDRISNVWTLKVSPRSAVRDDSAHPHTVMDSSRNLHGICTPDSITCDVSSPCGWPKAYPRSRTFLSIPFNAKICFVSIPEERCATAKRRRRTFQYQIQLM